MEENTKKHAEIARQIRLAKKAMFKRSREGMSLREAADAFGIDVINRIEKIVPHDESRPAFERGGSDEPPPAIEAAETDENPRYFTTEELEAIAHRFAMDYEYDEDRITPLAGFLGYLATLYRNIGRKNIHPDNVDDVVAVVTRSIYGRISCDAARQFEGQALNQLRQRFAGSEASHA